MQTAPPPAPADSGGGNDSATTKKSTPVRRRPPEEDPTDYWSYELFGCLSDWRLCCATFLCPCYTLGRNAEYFGDDGALSGLLYGLGLCAVRKSHQSSVFLSQVTQLATTLLRSGKNSSNE